MGKIKDTLVKRVVLKQLLKSKTVWAGIGLVLYGAFLIYQGDQENGIKAITEGFAIIFMRQGIEKAIQK